MGNLDHIQRSNADKISCQNCLYNHRESKTYPCNECKGDNDKHHLDRNKTPVLTGVDIGYPEVIKEKSRSDSVFCNDCKWLALGVIMPPICCLETTRRELREHNFNIPIRSLRCIKEGLYEKR